ncbi:MAG: hypothetical protein JNJ48_03295 [Phycisphaerae bacterium]|nr:hypothetical protein [Phycisphaerae bacterium]
MTIPNVTRPSPGAKGSLLRSPAALLLGSAIIGAAGTGVLALGGRWFGVAAFGGLNLLSLVLWLFVHRRAEPLVRGQSMAGAVGTWVASVAFSAGVVALYWWEFRLAATVVLGSATALYIAGLWMIDAGMADLPTRRDDDPGL